MKSLLIITTVFFALTARAGTMTNLLLVAETGGAIGKWISIPAGSTARIVNTGGTALTNCRVVGTVEGIDIDHPQPFESHLFIGPSSLGLILPAGFTGAVHNALITVDINPITTMTPVVTNIPSTAVVIPADSGGPVQILLESSVDLITWNSTLPGSYGTSTTNRFFRVRAVR